MTEDTDPTHFKAAWQFSVIPIICLGISKWHLKFSGAEFFVKLKQKVN